MEESRRFSGCRDLGLFEKNWRAAGAKRVDCVKEEGSCDAESNFSDAVIVLRCMIAVWRRSTLLE